MINGKKFSELLARVGVSLTGTEVVSIEGLAGTAYTASTISAAASDNSINDSAAGLPIIPIGAAVDCSGFVDASTELNGEQIVVSSTASKLVIGADITTDEAAGASVTVQEKNKSYKLPLAELANYIILLVTDGTEAFYDASGSSDLDRSNGSIQKFTMTFPTTFTIAINSGQSMLLHLYGGNSYLPTFPAGTWINGAPESFNAGDAIEIYKVESILFFAYVGSIS